MEDIEQKYRRSAPSVSLKKVKDKKLRRVLRENAKNVEESLGRLAGTELLLPTQSGTLVAETPLEQTHRFSQDEIRSQVDIQTQKKMFHLDLPSFGPYCADFTRNGKHLLLAGTRGHISLLDWSNASLVSETHVRDTVRTARMVHDPGFIYAAAQNKYVYLYDGRDGTELHCLRSHIDVSSLEVLPWHCLLVSGGRTGWIKYHDYSTGSLVSEIRTKMGPVSSMTQNSSNAVICSGHPRGILAMWSPTCKAAKPLVQMHCHRGPIVAIAVDQGGYGMVTCGVDHQMKVFDIRKMEEVHSYYIPKKSIPSAISASQKGMLAVSCGRRVEIWKDIFRGEKQKLPYMVHEDTLSYGNITGVRFCPYEDFVGVAYEKGYLSLVIPGSGEPNFDSFVVSPFESKSMRREREVHMFLDKLQPDMIALDPSFIGQVDKDKVARAREDAEAMEEKKAKHQRKKRKISKTGKANEKDKKIREKRREQLTKEDEKQNTHEKSDVLDRFRV